jgi:hypothetical protein
VEGGGDGEDLGGSRVELLKGGAIEGTVQCIDIVEKNIAVFSEFIPSWLAVADTWECENISLYCDKEQEWFRKSLKLQTSVKKYRVLAAMRDGSWMKEEKKLVLIQVSTGFCKKIISGFSEWGITEEDRLAVVVTNQFRNPPIRFKFKKFSHSDLGGVSTSKFSIGMTTGWGVDSIEAPDQEVARQLYRVASVIEPGKDIKIPGKECEAIKERTATAPEIISEEFILPNVINGTGWVKRRFTAEEAATALDFPVASIKRLKSESVDRTQCELWGKIPPVKAIQWAGLLIGKAISTQDKKGSDHSLPSDQSIGDGITKEEKSIEKDAYAGLSYSDADIYSKIEQSKAVKNDDALADFDIWNRKASEKPVFTDVDLTWKISTNHVLDRGSKNDRARLMVFEELKEAQSNQYKKNVDKSFNKYMRETYSEEELRDLVKRKIPGIELHTECERDEVVGRIALDKVAGASFWEWDEGSSPLFWRWQPEIQKERRDGTKLWVTGELPTEKARQIIPNDPALAALLGEKMDKVRFKGYIGEGQVISITHFFAVPKGEDDIRVVYDLTKNGLNDVLWTPNFWMPSMLNVLDCATEDSWFCDVDVGEMFLNFPLDVKIRPYCGVDLSWQLKGKRGYRWERWNRMAMGMSPSPWVCTRLLG